MSGLGFAALAACSAGGQQEDTLLTAQPDPDDQNPTPGAGGTGDVGLPIGGSDGIDLGDLGDKVEPMGCQQAQREFKPKIPTVYLLVDRSRSMFDTFPNGESAWTALRGGALQVMQELETGVRFGFAAFTGQRQGTGCLMDVPAVAPELNNYAAIAQVYNPLALPTNDQNKETPTLLALQDIAAQLRSDTSDSEKYILFVTDGEPDYCDDGNPLCPPDSVVALLQDLAAGRDRAGASYPPIRTIVFGLETPNVTILPTVLQSFANAGAGQPVAPLTPPQGVVYTPEVIYDQCNGVDGWKADFATTGKPAVRTETIGTYTTDLAGGGTAPVYRPDADNQVALANEIRLALSSVKSCTFDLGADGVEVDLTRSDLGEKAKVLINGVAIPFDAANGWRMLSETTVQLEGDACVTWRDPLAETNISFDFPCDIFIPA